MRSASAVASGLIVCALAGCATTQQEASRLRLNSARLRDSQQPTQVGTRDPEVRVAGVAAVREGRTTAVVVNLENLSAHPVSDLPLVVGYRATKRRVVYLNGAAGLDYFQTHVPAIAGHAQLRWVLTLARPVARAAGWFARVGSHASPAPTLPQRLPQIRAEAAAGRRSEVRINVVNGSAVPQYQLPVYAVARRGGRLVAAGQAAIGELAPHQAKSITLRLVGRPGGRLAVTAPPTMFS